MEPQITAIASFVVARIPTEGVEDAEAVDAWRTTLRHARRNGAIGSLTELMERAHPDDPELQKHIEALKR